MGRGSRRGSLAYRDTGSSGLLSLVPESTLTQPSTNDKVGMQFAGRAGGQSKPAATSHPLERGGTLLGPLVSSWPVSRNWVDGATWGIVASTIILDYETWGPRATCLLSWLLSVLNGGDSRAYFLRGDCSSNMNFLETHMDLDCKNIL
jgi:hypothetical protein